MHVTEPITIDDFALRLKISRSTAYSWLAQGRLVSGVHLLRIGRVVRVIWSHELLEHLLSISTCDLEQPQHPKVARCGRGGRNRIALDADLLENLHKMR